MEDVNVYNESRIGVTENGGDIGADYNPELMETYTLAAVTNAADVLEHYIIPTIAVLGLFGNVFILIVWSAGSNFNPTVFYMKGLAVTDIVGLSLVLIKIGINFPRHYIGMAIHILINVPHLCSLFLSSHTTMALVFARWIAIRRPTQYTAILTKCRAVRTYGLMLLWCFFCSSLVEVFIAKGVYYSEVHWSVNQDVLYFIGIVLCMAVPILVTVILNIRLIRMVYSHNASTILGLQQNTSARDTRSSQFRNMVVAVLCVSITTVLAHPVSVIIHALITFKTLYFMQQCGFTCPLLLYYTAEVLQVFNSSINVVYYLLFASQFRELLWHRYQRCLHLWTRSCKDHADREAPAGQATSAF